MRAAAAILRAAALSVLALLPVKMVIAKFVSSITHPFWVLKVRKTWVTAG